MLNLTSISPDNIKSLENFYTLREPTEVFQFIEKYPFLLPILLEAPAQIRRYFPSEQLFLQVVPDPEIVDYVQLVLSILTKLDPNEAMDREDELRDWSLSLSYEVRQQFCLLLQFPDEL